MHSSKPMQESASFLASRNPKIESGAIIAKALIRAIRLEVR